MVETLPGWLREGLRVNRSNNEMKDNDGVIWMLLAARGIGKEAKEGTTEEAIAYIRDVLWLGNEVTFPESNMVTLLRKEDWCAMITRWCGTVFGQRVFQIGRWTWIAGMQMNKVGRVCVSVRQNVDGRSGPMNE